jgi:histidine kinase 2/3/4 (cytokinin receptor)
MNGVLGMLKMLMDTDLDAKQMDYAQTAHGSGKDLTSLINEVLDQAKIESGRLELENVPFDMRFILDNVSSLLSGKANEKGIELAVYVSSQVPDVVVGDPSRFRQIITNLVGNSIKVIYSLLLTEQQASRISTITVLICYLLNNSSHRKGDTYLSQCTLQMR